MSAEEDRYAGHVATRDWLRGSPSTPRPAPDFTESTRVIRRWLAHQTVNIDALLPELRYWLDYFTTYPDSTVVLLASPLVGEVTP